MSGNDHGDFLTDDPYLYRSEDDYTSENTMREHQIYQQNANNEIRNSLSQRTGIHRFNFVAILLNITIFIVSLVKLFKYKDSDCSIKLQNCVIVETLFIGFNLVINYIFYKKNINAENIHQYSKINFLVKCLLFFGFVWFIVLQTIYFKESCDSNFKNLIITYIVFGYLAYTMYALNILLLLIFMIIICCNPNSRMQLLRMLVPKNNGINQEKLNEIPIIIFNPETTSIAKEKQSCAICMSDYEINNELREFTCKHTFHKKCVDQWLAVNSTCPLCRSDLNESLV